MKSYYDRKPAKRAEGVEAEAKAAAYRQFLEERAALKAQIDADCAELGIIGQ